MQAGYLYEGPRHATIWPVTRVHRLVTPAHRDHSDDTNREPYRTNNARGMTATGIQTSVEMMVTLRTVPRLHGANGGHARSAKSAAGTP